MIPVALVEGGVSPGGETAIFLGGRNDELEILRNVFLVRLKRGSAFPRVIAPRGEKLGGNLTVVVSDNFPDEGKLAFRYLIAERWDTAKK